MSSLRTRLMLCVLCLGMATPCASIFPQAEHTRVESFHEEEERPVVIDEELLEALLSEALGDQVEILSEGEVLPVVEEEVVVEEVVVETPAEEVVVVEEVVEAPIEDVVVDEVVAEEPVEEIVEEAPAEEVVVVEEVVEAPVEDVVVDEVVAEEPVEEIVEEVVDVPAEEAVVEDVVVDEVVAEEVVEEEIVEEVAGEEATVEEVDVPTEAIDPDLFDTGQTTMKESLVDVYPEIFSLGTFLKINTTSDPKGSYIDNIDTIGGTINSYKLAKLPGSMTWDDPTVLRHTHYVYALKLAFDEKYDGYRDSALGLGLEKMLGLTERYEGTILFDEYKNYALWNVTLKDVVELRAFLKYLRNCLAEKGRRKFDELKPVIRLRLDDDVLLKSLDIEDWAHLNMLFNVVSPADLETIKHFDELQYRMNDVITELSSGSLIYPKEGFRKHVLRKLEGYFKAFEVKEASTKFITIIGAAAGFFVINECLKIARKKMSDCIWPPEDPKNVTLLKKILEALQARGAEGE